MQGGETTSINAGRSRRSAALAPSAPGGHPVLNSNPVPISRRRTDSRPGWRQGLHMVISRVAAPKGAPFHSVLVEGPEKHLEPESPEEPAYFSDLNLDQMVAAVTAGREEYDLEPVFSSPLHDIGTVRYRQAVLRDLDNPQISACVRSFGEQMRRVRGRLASVRKIDHRYFREGWFLDAVELYCEAVTSLADGLASPVVRSRGLEKLREYLATYVRSATFEGMTSEMRTLRRDLAAVNYAINIRGTRITVSDYGGEPAYSAEVEESFARFKQGAVKDYRATFPELDMGHVQARVLDLVARLHPGVFSALDQFCASHDTFVDGTVEVFDREVQFYLAYLDFIARIKDAGLHFCFPEVTEQVAASAANDSFDIVLANDKPPGGSAVVCNSFYLHGPERLLVVTGPNQGGKTTFARTFGQLHYLASLGLTVPARTATLFLPDRIYTHFERVESLGTLRGKLEDELVRAHDILQRATARSIVIMNETFTSTTLDDALSIGEKVVSQMVNLGVVGVYVTFVDELASLSDATVSMVAEIDPLHPTERTFKIVRKPADGLAYAGAIAERYRLTYGALMKRLAS